ncbi:MAG: hypothetical protein HGA59_06365 [Chlorobiaceae bacterium]|nr:hypothetical protein [Chlorobiaceae bacterium]NTV15885.1 hypothetical protein [Chlorobiaceae bacterium]
MKKAVVFAMILLFAGCAYLDEGGRRDRDRHDRDRRDRDPQRREQIQNQAPGSLPVQGDEYRGR